MVGGGDRAGEVGTEEVRLLEACTLFNAGIGAVYTRDVTHELDACVMDGNTLKAGAVAGLSHVRPPVPAPRLATERSAIVLLVGPAGESVALPQAMSRVQHHILSPAS
ncbi:isoaspartyl peptidase/L-asparaginase, partial [Salmonella enterica]|uniref:isoaspartyl peptidase/L-asparaginase n=1 Tax=Salmonella enterica TaxID=28901 RepID=UPI00398C2A10